MVCDAGWESAGVDFGGGNFCGVDGECVAAGDDEAGAASCGDLRGGRGSQKILHRGHGGKAEKNLRKTEA